MRIVDVNILIYVVNPQSQFHAKVLAWWNRALSGEEVIGLPWLSISGFVRIATNLRLFDVALTVEEAGGRVDAWLGQANVQVVREADNHWTFFREYLRESGSGGNRVPDAHLAALAVSRGATLVSCDAGFARFRHLRWENPAA